MAVHKVGCCGFPVGLEKYAKIFRVVEVQTTFYQPPATQTLEKWKARVPEGFEFTLKAWQLITQESSSPTYRRLRQKLTDREKRDVGSFRVNDTVLGAWNRKLECSHAGEQRQLQALFPRDRSCVWRQPGGRGLPRALLCHLQQNRHGRRRETIPATCRHMICSATLAFWRCGSSNRFCGGATPLEKPRGRTAVRLRSRP